MVIKVINFIINFYQRVISVTFFSGVCKFEVSCSEYTKQMIIRCGVLKGIGLGMKRIGSCR